MARLENMEGKRKTKIKQNTAQKVPKHTFNPDLRSQNDLGFAIVSEHSGNINSKTKFGPCMLEILY